MGDSFRRPMRRHLVGGMVRAVAPDQLPAGAFVTAHNVTVRDGEIRKVMGWTAHPGRVDGAVTFVRPLWFPNGREHLVVGTPSGLYQVDQDGTVTSLGEAGGVADAAERWEAEYLKGKWYFTNRIHGLKSWDGAAPLQSVPSGGVLGGSLAQYHRHLIMGRLRSGTNDGPYTWVGSQLWEPAQWDFDNPNSEAYLEPIPDGGDEIYTVRRLGRDSLAIYKLGSIHVANYVGLPQVYARAGVVSNNGLRCPYSVVDTGDYHLYPAVDNIRAFNGGSNDPVGDAIWNWWRQDVQDGTWATQYALGDPRFNEAIFAYQPAGQDHIAAALVYNYRAGVFTTRDWPFHAAGWVRKRLAGELTFDEITTPMDSMNFSFEGAASLGDYDLLGSGLDGGLYRLDEQTETAAGADLTATLETGDINIGQELGADPQSVGLCDGLALDVPTLTGQPLLIYVAARMDLGAALNWSGPYQYSGGGFAHLWSVGRWLRFRLVKTGGRFALRGYGPSIRITGRH